MDQANFKKIEIKFSQCALLMIFFTLLATFFIFEGNKFLYGKIDQIKEKEKQKTALENRMKNLDNLGREYKNVSSDVAWINNLLPSQDTIVNIISSIENLASANHVELATKFKSDPANHKLTTELTVKGYFSDVMKFYHQLAEENILVYIKAVNISDSNNMLDNAKAILETEVYFD